LDGGREGGREGRREGGRVVQKKEHDDGFILGSFLKAFVFPFFEK